MAYLKKKIKYLQPDPELTDFYYPSEVQKSGALLFVAVSTGIVTYALCKHIK